MTQANRMQHDARLPTYALSITNLSKKALSVLRGEDGESEHVAPNDTFELQHGDYLEISITSPDRRTVKFEWKTVAVSFDGLKDKAEKQARLSEMGVFSLDTLLDVPLICV